MMPHDCLPLWKWQHPDQPGAEIIPIYASLDIQRGLPSINNDKGRIKSITKALSIHEGFNGLVYFMRNKENPDVVKIGSSQDVMKRMSSSPWCKSLDYTKPEARKIELIFVCLKISNRIVEAQANSYFAPPKLMKNGGREWFHATSGKIINFIKEKTLQFDGWVADQQLIQKPCRELLKEYINQSLEPRFLSDLGSLLSVYKRGNELTVYSSQWLPVRSLSSPVHYDIPERASAEEKAEFSKIIKKIPVNPFDRCIDIEVYRGMPRAVESSLNIDLWDRCYFRDFGHENIEIMTDYDLIYEHVEYSAHMIFAEVINIDKTGRIVNYKFFCHNDPLGWYMVYAGSGPRL